MTEQARTSGPPPTLTRQAVSELLVDTEPYLSCDECFERIDRFVERRRADPAATDLEMDTHLAGCSVCADEARALVELLDEDVG